MKKANPDTFWNKVEKTDGCWLWKAYRNPLGYGMVNWDRRTRPAHRVAYELVKGPIPPGLVLDHLCRNPPCVNPDHLEAVTQIENVRRGNGGLHHRIKTHCKNGHALEGDNIIVRQGKKKGRRCRICAAAENKARYERLKPSLKKRQKQYTAFGRTQSLGAWGREFGIHYDWLASRLRFGWDLEAALTCGKSERGGGKGWQRKPKSAPTIAGRMG